MTELLTITVPGRLIPKGDPKPDWKHHRFYMPPEYKKCVEKIRFILVANRVQNLGKARVGLDIVFHRWGRADLDELDGTVMDAFEGLVYDNDVQVDEKYSRKEKAEKGEEKTVITIREVK